MTCRGRQYDGVQRNHDQIRDLRDRCSAWRYIGVAAPGNRHRARQVAMPLIFDLDGNKIEAVTGVWFVLVIGRVTQ